MSLFGSWTVDIATAVAVVLATTYYYYAIAYNFWTKKNVPQIRPTIPFFETYKIFAGKVSFSEVLGQGYKKYKENGFWGSYSFARPVLLVSDPELIKHILSKDFTSFHDHGVPNDPDMDPLGANLFNLGGQRWKALRSKLSPTFTSGKIKGMFSLIHECVDELQDCVRQESKKNAGSVEMQNLLMRYCADVIGSCAFGIKCNCLKNPNAEFQLMGREMLTTSFRNFLQFFVVTCAPKLQKYFNTRWVFPKTSKFFTGLMNDTVKHRREKKVTRNDFVQLMMQIQDDEKEKGEDFFNQDIMTAQATIFFIAGLDNVANEVGFCLHHMALDQELQQRVYDEITSVLEASDETISYEAVKKMELVSRVFDEGLRRYSPAGFLMREQTGDKYVIPGTDVVLGKGTAVMIPIDCIHNDEKHFPNPEKFDPDRFLEEEKTQRHPFSYIPFGEGPRFCIASRFAKLEMRLCFAELVRRFEFHVAPETDLSLELDKTTFSPTPLRGFWLKVKERV